MTGNFYIFHIFAQSRAVAFGACAFAAVACFQNAVLHPVLIAVDPAEEAVDTFPMAVAMP